MQEFEFGIFKELVDRYDADGYELDWMRFWEHLTPGREREQTHVLTEFMARCRAYAKSKEAARGHPIYLSTRVPSSWAAAQAFGYDPVTWAKRGLVEMIAVANFFAADDFDCGFADWKRRIKAANPDVAVLASACDNVGAGPGLGILPADLAAWRGWADNVYAEGSEGLYFFNVAYKSDEIQKTIYNEGFSAGDCAAKARRHLVSYHDCTASPDQMENQLPKPAARDQLLKVNVGSAASASARVEVVVAYDGPAACPAVALNGCATVLSARRASEVRRYGDKARQAWTLAFPATALKAGNNDVKVARAAPEDAKTRLVWTEIAVNVPLDEAARN